MRLTQSTRRAHYAPCLQTTGNGIGVPNSVGGQFRRPGGFFTSTACAAVFMAGRVGEPQGSPVPTFRYANPIRTRHPRLASEGGTQTANVGVSAMRTSATGTPAHILTLSRRLTFYRALRVVFGPAVAFRLALGRTSS